MLLEKVQHYNDFSPKFRKELDEKVKSFGKVVRYKFDIHRNNPDPMKIDGEFVWPSMYVLDPAVFTIRDPYEDRENVSKIKNVGLVLEVDERGMPRKFKKIKAVGRDKGIVEFRPEEIPDDYYSVMFMELHPKHKGGKFQDTTKHLVFTRIDENIMASQERRQRTVRKQAMDAAESMTMEELIEFADAMMWDSTMDELILRNKAEELAEQYPDMFIEKINDKKTKIRATINRAVTKRILIYDPVDCRLTWSDSGQLVVTLGASVAGMDDYERLADWFLTAGKKADEVIKKITAMEKTAVTT